MSWSVEAYSQEAGGKKRGKVLDCTMDQGTSHNGVLAYHLPDKFDTPIWTDRWSP